MPTTATVTPGDLAQEARAGLFAAADLLLDLPFTLAQNVPVVLDLMLADADSVRHIAARMGSPVEEKRLGWFTVVQTRGELDGIRVSAHAHVNVELRRNPAATAELAERDA